jgi:hypothetical protein
VSIHPQPEGESIYLQGQALVAIRIAFEGRRLSEHHHHFLSHFETPDLYRLGEFAFTAASH